MADQRSASRDRAGLIRLRSYSIAKERRRDQPRLGERLAQVRAYLLAQTEGGCDMPTDEEQLKQVNSLMVPFAPGDRERPRGAGRAHGVGPVPKAQKVVLERLVVP
jgi:hypothetical protein